MGCLGCNRDSLLTGKLAFSVGGRNHEKPKKRGYPATPKTARMMWDDHFRLWNSVHNCNLGASPCRQPSNWPALLPPGLCCIDHQHCARLTDVLQDGVENRQEVHGTPSLRIFIVVNGIQWACGTTQGWKRANAPCKILVWAVWGQNPKPWADKIWWLCVLLTIQLYSLGIQYGEMKTWNTCYASLFASLQHPSWRIGCRCQKTLGGQGVSGFLHPFIFFRFPFNLYGIHL